MARIKIDLPKTFTFSTSIDIRISDLNYGGHVGNDTILSLLHEARVRFLQHYGYSELNLEGIGIIMGDVAIEYKAEGFYGDRLNIQVCADEFTRVSFDIFYKIEKEHQGKNIVVAIAKTGIVGYDYNLKKVAAIPEKAKLTLTGNSSH
ncbi:acyl-CoA thioesterase [Pinibacter aurantiacus]|uniref:Thioesterase family protein n=1 Tax=Pinibacter aurantiacus TaxID=2851599 RepID=A0A9E2S9C5_9BACT|nr:thioesterase family protein [Pinibacter aurantiacus]MBV4358301.1 thioesterase family protein [Pinibacter aurantiacus]